MEKGFPANPQDSLRKIKPKKEKGVDMKLKLFFVCVFLILAAYNGFNYFHHTEIVEPKAGGFALIFLGLAVIGGVLATKKEP